MKISKISVIVLLFGLGSFHVLAQTTSASNNLVVQPVPDRTVTFSLADSGVAKPITWGLDLAWLSETNIRRGIAFMGAGRVDVVRASFQPTLALVNGDLQTAQITDLNTRLNLIDLTGLKTKVILNCDHPSVDASYIGNATNWAQLMDITTRRVQERGRTVVSVSPFNEPDYGWGQYSGSNGQLDFFNICTELRKNTRFDSIRICGANTLNCDQALPWYNYLKTKLDEGNTHQLAGTFDNFATFFTTVRANGDHATADELHNVMESMVGVEYGMQTGIWWGTAELARGEFVKASDGKRLGYAEHRTNWTAASVYRNLDGKVQAFGGTSERQGATTTYRFVSKDKDVYYDGYGPQREYSMVLPGGTVGSYQNGQTNAERVVNITWGDDIQPAINGRYILVNRMSGKVMSVPLGSTTIGILLRQYANTGAIYQQWNVTPVDSRIGGDFSYFTITAVHSAQAIDVLNFSLDDGAAVEQYTDNKNINQQWYFDYAGDGWFYIRSRNSAKCLEAASPYITAGAAIQQREKGTTTNQQWRLLPVGATVEFDSPSAPTNLATTANATSVRLDWTASPETDVAGYSVFRSESAGGPYNTIARNVKSSSFVDNTTVAGINYFYAIKAVDNSLNRSGYSNEVSAIATGAKELVAHLQFDGNTMDSTINLNHSASYGTISYTTGKVGSQAISFNGTSTLQLPATVANYKELTIATWVYWNGITSWQRIFDFGNDQTQYMFLTPKAGTGQMRFAIKNGGTEQVLNTTVMPYVKWTHVAVTLNSTGAHMYVNGLLAAESSAITINSFDFKPVQNYIGRSQFSDPLFNGNIDDFRVYNYALSATEIAQIAGLISGVKDVEYNSGSLSLSPIPANNLLHVSYDSENITGSSTLTVLDMKGRSIMSKDITNETELNVSNLASGVYLLKLTNNKESVVKKLIVNH